MVGAYGDPHTIFLEPPAHELQSNALEGKFGGIGADLGRDEDGYYVVFPYPDSPASQAGIEEGDRLLAVDEQMITPETPVENVQSTIRGPVGSMVTLTIGRPPDYAPQEMSIRRVEFPLPSVAWRLDPIESRVGVLKVNLIAASTPDEIEDAVADLQARGATHFVLDLRDNPGGLLTAGVEIARLFLEEGIVMQQQYRGKEVETYEVNKPGALKNVPLTVVINHSSASAAEIAAGALQVHKRAPLVGSPSFGKDTVQLVFVLQDESSLRVTSARWWIPGLEPPIGENGLQPDIPVPPAEDPSIDSSLQAAIQALLSQ
jgi:carboxyl-terminal processing protease